MQCLAINTPQYVRTNTYIHTYTYFLCSYIHCEYVNIHLCRLHMWVMSLMETMWLRTADFWPLLSTTSPKDEQSEMRMKLKLHYCPSRVYNNFLIDCAQEGESVPTRVLLKHTKSLCGVGLRCWERIRKHSTVHSHLIKHFHVATDNKPDCCQVTSWKVYSFFVA